MSENQQTEKKIPSCISIQGRKPEDRELIERLIDLRTERNATSFVPVVRDLLAAYDNTADDTDRYQAAIEENEELNSRITSLEGQKSAAESKLAECEQQLADMQQQLADMQQQLAETEQLANANAQAATASALEADSLRLKHNQIVVDLHPVVAHFLNQYATKVGKTAGWCLADLFARDIQNPRANNLQGGFFVSSLDIEREIARQKQLANEKPAN